MAKKKEEKNETMEFVKKIAFDKRVLWGATIIIFLVILYFSVSMRMSNLDRLIDETTGLYSSNDLDSLYFYREAETQLNLGYLPEVDELRSPGYNIGWIPEIIDDTLIWNYKILHFFNSNISFNYASTISAPIFFAIGLILFFIMSLLLTKSKVASIVASAFLAFSPGFLFRSIAGFYDHDHIGVFAIFMLMIGSYFAFKRFEKSWKESVLFGALVGILTALVYVSWGGAITFVLVFFPIVALFYYLFNSEDKLKFLVFYFIFIVSSILFTSVFGSSWKYMVDRVVDSQGILVLFVFGLAFIDFFVHKYGNNFKFLKEKYYQIYSVGITIVLGIIGLSVIGKNPISLFKKAWATLIYPFFGEFGDRLSATVAENAQPYLTDLINQNGIQLFWLFIFGLICVSIMLTKNIKKIENKVILSGGSLFLMLAILFSRYSSSSLFNGENFISQALYLAGGIAFILGVSYIHYKEKSKLDIENIILLSMAITVVINARAAIRSFFLITPFICLIAGYSIAIVIKKLGERNIGEDKK